MEQWRWHNFFIFKALRNCLSNVLQFPCIWEAHYYLLQFLSKTVLIVSATKMKHLWLGRLYNTNSISHTSGTSGPRLGSGQGWHPLNLILSCAGPIVLPLAMVLYVCSHVCTPWFLHMSWPCGLAGHLYAWLTPLCWLHLILVTTSTRGAANQV